MEAEQLHLFDRPLVDPEVGPEATMQERFEAFHAANPHVYDAIVTLARRAKHSGMKQWSVKAIFEVLRFEWQIQTKSDDEFRLNNNFTALYARMVLRSEADLADFFEVRRRHAA